MFALSAALVSQHGGEVPHDRNALEAIPGVGRKTANVVLNEIFGDETCAVDTHIFRVANRTGLAPGTTPRAVEDGLMAVIPGLTGGTRITGCCSTAAMSASRAVRAASSASFPICVRICPRRLRRNADPTIHEGFSARCPEQAE